MADIQTIIIVIKTTIIILIHTHAKSSFTSASFTKPMSPHFLQPGSLAATETKSESWIPCQTVLNLFTTNQKLKTFSGIIDERAFIAPMDKCACRSGERERERIGHGERAV